MDQQTLLLPSARPATVGYRTCKRVLDVSLSCLGLLLLSPVCLVVALGIKMDSGGPIFYAARRRGLEGREFRCFKFRSMYQDAEIGYGVEKSKQDPRVTGFGYWIRKYSLDEIPQLWNVLRGEMSLVGPRPLPERDHQRLSSKQLKRYDVLPGLTGLWQVSGRSDLSFTEMNSLDLSYTQQPSLWQDAVIILRTIPAVILARGAY